MKTNPSAIPLTEILPLSFILYYGYSGFSKLWDYPLFVMLSRFQPYLNQLPVAMKWLFPFTDLLLAGLLLFQGTRKPVFWMIFILQFIIIIYRSFLLLKGLHLPCLCGAFIRKLNEQQHLAMNICLLAGAVGSLFLFTSKTKSP